MKRELGIARCGLVCCLCSENGSCPGCRSDGCGGKSWCVNRRCSIEKGLDGCFDCREDCRKGILAKANPYAFTQFARRFGRDALLDCPERGEKEGVVYHRSGITGDYDDFDDAGALMEFLRTGNR